MSHWLPQGHSRQGRWNFSRTRRVGVHQQAKRVTDVEEMVRSEIKKQKCGRTRQVSQSALFRQAKEKEKVRQAVDSHTWLKGPGLL